MNGKICFELLTRMTDANHSSYIQMVRGIAVHHLKRAVFLDKITVVDINLVLGRCRYDKLLTVLAMKPISPL